MRGGVAENVSTDAELVERCLRDRKALDVSFRSIYDRHAGAAWRFLRSMVGDGRADDCLQETFIRVFRSLDRWDRGRPIRPWILTIAHRVAVDALRASARRPAATGLTEVAAPGGAETVPAAASDREVGSLLDAAVRGLPERQREVFLLKQVEGLTFDQVADALRCSVRTAKTRMREATDLLAATLRRRGLVAGGEAC